MEKSKFYVVHLQMLRVNLQESRLEHVKSISISEYGCEGVEEYGMNEEEVDELLGERAFSGGDLPWEIFEEVERSHATKDDLHYKFYFGGASGAEDAELFLKYLVAELPNANVSLVEEEVLDWNSEWKQFYAPIKVSEYLEIIPSFHDEAYQSMAKHQVYIYPGMGFGTGEHETTFLCLKLASSISIEERMAQGSCLDFGCGSGILGIAARKLGYKRVVLADIDSDALENSSQNLNYNFTEKEQGNFQVLLLEKGKRASIDGEFELVFANILMNVLLQEREFLFSKLSSGGFLILSGILREQAESIKEAFSSLQQLTLVAQENKGDWSALMFKSKR
ncbi:MAG: 50S ribosomal protein L11 methyltransferase [Oligoflexia bacterium]|nr:50S ribosomal protein L11 methyltransferase [Oligoflexia bacterium]